LLLPLRLEYRVVTRNVPFAVSAVVPATSVATVSSTGGAAPTAAAPTAGTVARTLLRVTRRTPAKTEIWFRWYPDEAFAEEGIPPPTEEETQALARFNDVVRDNGGTWHDLGSPAIADAWEQLVREHGFARSLHLQRHLLVAPAADWQDRIGRIVDLPRAFQLFAIRNGNVELLATSNSLPDDAGAVRYTPSALAASATPTVDDSGAAGWITDFGKALELGLALKLRDDAKVAAALGADWIVCVGLSEPSRATQLERFLTDAIANGNFELLRQDVATNSGHDVKAAYHVEPRDPVAALANASFAERRGSAEPPSDADRLAAALGVPADLLFQAPGAGLREIDAAADMMRALLPALLDVLFKWFPQTLDRDTLGDFLIETTSARGTIPALRVRRNAYGVLPVMPLAKPQPAAGTSAESQQAFQFAQTLGLMALENSVSRVANVPVIEPGGTDTAQKFESILRLAPLGHRIDVNQLGADPNAAKRLGCPYVEAAENQPADYLMRIARQPLSQLPDPTEADKSTPLLYRLVRLSAELLRAELPSPLNEVSLANAAIDQGLDARRRERLRGFIAALEKLAGLSGPQLETLMIEVLDLLHYRGDAWLSGLAQHRLQALRKVAPQGLQLGYYGLLGKLRSASATGGGDGYLQAPSAAHAVTVALLRSAARRFQNSAALKLNLSSSRVRLALNMLEALRAGLSLRQTLGTRGERHLHDMEADAAIFVVREAFPLPRTGGEVDSVPFDGLALIEKEGSDGMQLSAALRTAVNEMKAELRAQLDAFADLVIAEAVHQLAGGNAESAGAWVRVLSGDPIPGQPEVIRTQRAGQATTHRVAVVLDPRPFAGTNPRSIADPALARLAAAALPDFAAAAVDVKATVASLVTGRLVQRTKRYRLRHDLGLEPIDLVIGGDSEVQVRARARTHDDLRDDDGFFEESEAFTLAERTLALRERATLVVDSEAGAPKVATLLAAAGTIRRLLRAARPLEPEDVDAARIRSERDDDALRSQVSDGLQSLARRCEKLADQVDALRSEVAAAFRTAIDQARSFAALPASADSAARAAAIVALRAARQPLDELLRDVARYGLPQALRLVTDQELTVAPTAYAEHLTRLLSQLDAKRAELRALTGSTPADTSRADLNAKVERTRVALRNSCGGEGLPISLPFPRGAALPDLQGPADTLPEEIASWGRLRPHLELLEAWFASMAAAKVWRVEDQRRPFDAQDDLDPPDRPNDERPPSRHDATFVGLPGNALEAGSTVTRYAGFVVDEWSEFRPSSIQHTALAVNYDAPQSEPPHTLLLGVPTNASPWSHVDAAGLVRDTIRLMQMRALPSREAAFSQFAGRWFSVIPPKGNERRIPTRSRPTFELPDFPIAIARVTTPPPVSRTAADLDERRRPGDES
jgi:hypothetical protein